MARARVQYAGVTWTRRDDGYYAGRADGRRWLLHRYVYTREVGPIPPRWHVHHRDFDKANNTAGNLQALTPRAHALLHVKDAEWHAKGGRAVQAALRERSAVCTRCGATFTSRATVIPRYCGSACRDRGAPSRAHEPRVCCVCGGGFTCPRRNPTRTCSPACRSVAAYAARTSRAGVGPGG